MKEASGAPFINIHCANLHCSKSPLGLNLGVNCEQAVDAHVTKKQARGVGLGPNFGGGEGGLTILSVCWKDDDRAELIQMKEN